MNKKGYSFKILVLMLLVNFAKAQEIWSLEKCVRTALDNNLNIKSTKLLQRSNEVDVTSARHARYPDLSVGSNVSWNFGRTIDPTSNTFTTETFFRNGLSLSSAVTLYNGSTIKNNLLRQKNEAKALAEDLQQGERDIALEVASTYLNAIFAKENIEIATSNIALTKASLTQIQTLIKTGTKAPNEALDIEAQLANDEQSLLTASNNYLNTKMQLRQLMLTNDDFDVKAPENIELNRATEVMEFQELYNEALKNQHGIIADQHRLESSDLSLKIAKGQRYPTVGLGGNFGTNYSNKGQVLTGFSKAFVPINVKFNNLPATLELEQSVANFKDANYFNQFSNNVSYGVGFSVNMPILNNYRTTSGIEKAKINNESAQINLETKKQALKVNVQTSLTNARAAKQKLAASEKALTANQAAYDNANKKFTLGAITSFDLTNARTRLDNAKTNLLISKYDYIFKSKILDFYLGKGITIN